MKLLFFFPIMSKKSLCINIQRKRGIIISENLIIVLAIIAIVAITTIAFVTLVSLSIYFTEKKVKAEYKNVAELEGIKTESNVSIVANNEK